MIIDEEKSFGYPVLRPLFTEQSPSELDYVNCPFEPSLGMEFDRTDPDKYIFSWEYECHIDAINAGIKSGAIKVMLNIYNRETWYNEFFEIEPGVTEGEVKIDKSCLSGEINMRLLLTAEADLEISSKHIHDDYGYSSFNLNKNSVVGFSEEATYDARPNLLKKISSIFMLYDDSELSMGEFYYDATEDHVKIYAHEDQIRKFRDLEASERLQSIIIAALYAPVITDLVKLVLEKRDDELDPLTELIWFRTIRDKIDELPADKVMAHKPTITAHHLLKRPLSNIVADL